MKMKPVTAWAVFDEMDVCLINTIRFKPEGSINEFLKIGVLKWPLYLQYGYTCRKIKIMEAK